MANMAALLKSEITRLARREIRGEIESLKKASTQYRSDIAALKRRVAALEQQVSRLGKSAAKHAEAAEAAEAGSTVRFSVKGFKSLRERLGLSAGTMGSLLGVTAQTVYNWEGGSSRPREEQLARIATLRSKGKREVLGMVDQLA